MSEAVARFRAASEAGDVEGMMAALAPAPRLVSPISGRLIFHGEGDLRVLLTAIYRTMRDVRWGPELGDGEMRVVLGEAKVGPLRLTDAMVLDLAGDGKIQAFRPHLRPWLGLTLLALALAPKLARHPGVMWRAARRG